MRVLHCRKSYECVNALVWTIMIGFTRNAVTERKMADLLERARLQFLQTGKKARLFDHVYYAAASWDAPPRLVMLA